MTCQHTCVPDERIVLRRRDLSARFQKTIEEVSTKMDKQGQDYVASLKENETYVCALISRAVD